MSDLFARAQAALSSGESLRRGRDFIAGHALAATPTSVRRRLFHGNQHHCPLCESDIREFLPLYRDFYSFCPVCMSLPRHRLVWLFLQRRTHLQEGHIRLLHIAPEPSLEARLRRVPGLQYLSGDLFSPRAMEKMDVCNIHHPDGAFDALYCSHVLEHVPDDHKAMREFHRVLAPAGWALILVPMTNGATDEDPSITDPVERQRRFGQHDHVRIYGRDVADRLAGAGFGVQTLCTEDIASENEIRSMSLTRGETMFFCSA
jgi:hypothetical protein